MTPIERAIAAVNNTARVHNITGDQQGVLGHVPFHCVTNPEEVARAVLEAIREPSEAMVAAADAWQLHCSDTDTLFTEMINAALSE